MTGIHFLLTYACNRACDHCFVYSSPEAKGTFTLRQIRDVFDELAKIPTIEQIYFEGGEPFLFYPVMVSGLRIAREMGYEAGIVTNAYWATSVEDALEWLRPLAQLGLGSLSVSDDTLHYGNEEREHWAGAQAAAGKLGIKSSLFRTEPPSVETDESGGEVVAGGVMFRGRAAERLVDGLPTRPWDDFTECPAENPREPGRVHLDSYGNVHICQGMSMGNMWETPLAELVAIWDGDAHPICGPLLRGGPAALVREYDVGHAARYVSACHLCYQARRALVDRFEAYLAPRQIYGLD